jgi:hypothetical protein
MPCLRCLIDLCFFRQFKHGGVVDLEKREIDSRLLIGEADLLEVFFNMHKSVVNLLHLYCNGYSSTTQLGVFNDTENKNKRY